MASSVIPKTEIVYHGLLQSGTDLDNVRHINETGFWYVGNPANYTNCPAGYSTLIVTGISNNDTSGAYQICMTKNKMYFRSATGSPIAWGDWHDIAYDGSLAKFKLPSQTSTDVKAQMVATTSFANVDSNNDPNALTFFSVSGTSDTPSAANRWFGLQWLNASGKYGMCIAFSFGADSIYIKRKNNSDAWTSWEEISAKIAPPVLLADTQYPNSTEVISYACDWKNYRLLSICIGTYNNIMSCAVVPTDYFNTTTSGSRPQLFVFTSAGAVQFYANVYKNGDNAVYINFSNASAYARVRIWGIK